MSDHTFHYDLDHCPHCAAPSNQVKMSEDLAAIAGGAIPPSPGSHTICPQCGNMNVFNEQMKRRKMTAEELAALPAEARALLEQMRADVEWLNRQASIINNEPPGNN